jgi:hypothetical protein
MRFAVLALVVAVGCGSKSKLDADGSSDVDSLWKLAPDGTELGVVASPRAVGLGFRALAQLRELTKQPDMAPLEGQLYAITKGMFGSETATPEDAGFATDRGFATFATTDGVVAVMPVGDRDKFMTARKGTRGSAEDTLEGYTCRPRAELYVCATNVALFDRIGNGSLKGKLAAAGARGDAELYVTAIPLLGANKGDLAVAAKLDAGQVAIHGSWTGEPDGVLQPFIGIAAPAPSVNGASGFVVFDVKPLLDDVPALPVGGDVTLDQIAKSLAGPFTAVIPAGSVDVQISAPLVDPKPLQTVLASCENVGKFFELAKVQTPGACRIVLQGTNALELDVWVDGTTLRLGAKKGAMPAGKPGAVTAFGRELANGNWTAAFWGRGTMLNLTGIAPATQDVSRDVALGIHAMALINELGGAVRVDKDGVKFRGMLRTAWANPPNVADKVIGIGGNDIVTGKAMEPAKAIASSAPGTPFAADYDAGQGGLMVPAAMIGLASAVAIPILVRMFGGGGADEDVPTEAPPLQAAPL